MKVGKNKWEAGRLHKGYSPIDSNLLLYTFFSSSHEVKLDRRSVSSLKRSEHSDEDVFFCISVRLLCNARDIIFSNDWPYRLFSFATSILIGKGTGLLQAYIGSCSMKSTSKWCRENVRRVATTRLGVITGEHLRGDKAARQGYCIAMGKGCEIQLRRLTHLSCSRTRIWSRRRRFYLQFQ